MKKWLPWLFVALFGGEALIMALVLANAKPKPDVFDVAGFGKLPVLLNGRVQPLDSVARNTLLQLRSTQDVPLEEVPSWKFWKHPKKLKPTEWLLEVFMKPEQADERRVFLIHHPELLTTLKLEDKGAEKSGLRYYSFNEIKPVLEQIEKLGKQSGMVKEEVQTPFQKQVAKLYNAVILYHHRLKNSLKPARSSDFAAELEMFRKLIPEGFLAIQRQQAKQEYDKEIYNQTLELAESYAMMAEVAYPLLIPPVHLETSRDDWSNVGKSLLDSIRSGEIHPAVTQYAAMSAAYNAGNTAEFNRVVAQYSASLAGEFTPELDKGRREFFFNNIKPFYRAMLIYIVAFLLGCASWFNWSAWLRKSAFYLIVLAWIIHTFGLVFRMVLEGRPPVTNLYSSAIFIGWGAVVLGVVLERIYQDGIGSVVAALMGFVTQIIAHNLALGGDTMEMMRAVLDTNFWLATHVVIITLGYASTFFAGFLAIVYIARGILTRTLSEATAKGLTRMVYGIVCFATLFSLVGTILGGIWADQSWGRFWGWDPKENGALLIVIWNATILHARWGGMVKERGLMNLAVFGNIVTSFSWFGVNMLGIGLHSYGFMDAAFKWLMLFVASQVLIIGFGLLPARYWKSFQDVKSSGSSPPSSPQKTLPVGKPKTA